MKTWTIDADHDIRVASWRIAGLLFGPDDGSMERDDIECQVQRVIAESFTETERRDSVLAFFAQFVRVLNDADDPDADRENRLEWAWSALAEFADAMGPDFAAVANIEGRLEQ